MTDVCRTHTSPHAFQCYVVVVGECTLYSTAQDDSTTTMRGTSGSKKTVVETSQSSCTIIHDNTPKTRDLFRSNNIMRRTRVTLLFYYTFQRYVRNDIRHTVVCTVYAVDGILPLAVYIPPTYLPTYILYILWCYCEISSAGPTVLQCVRNILLPGPWYL